MAWTRVARGLICAIGMVVALTSAPAVEVTLSWRDNASNEAGYRIERSSNGVAYVQLAVVGANVTSFTDTTGVAAAPYWFRVRAYNAAGDSSYSNIASATMAPTVPANTAPTITNLADRTCAEDTGTGAIAFTVGDAQTAAGSLVVSASSSNVSLVPASGLALGGSGASRTLTVTPVANQSGTATITLAVSDGTSTATDSFVLTVTAVNDIPMISGIADRTINAGTSTGAITFTVGDVETAAGSLTVSGLSSHATLVPASGISFGGSGANRTVTVNPAAGQSGSATITVTVSDGAGTAQDAFVLTVNAVSTAPTISDLANQSINEDGATASVPFTVGDAQTAADSLTVIVTSSNPTLMPASGLVLGGTGANRTLTLRPAADQHGTATITVQVSDGVFSVTDTFVLTVVAVNDAPTLSAIPGQTIERGGRTGPITVSVSDVETAAGSLALSASSSNPALVPVAGISFGGSGVSRTVTVTPVAWQSGTASITVMVSDGTRTTSQAFSVAVTFASQLVVGADIGAPALAGSTTSANGIFTMRAAGADIWGTKDQFHFAHQQIPGDAELIVRVSSLVQTHVWTKVGLMFRAGLGADAAHVSVFVTPQRGVTLQWRAANGGLTAGSPSLPGTAPKWLRLVRTGDTVYALRSENGVAWELVGSATVNLPDVAFGGMAASSIKAQEYTTATFEHFQVSESDTFEPPVTVVNTAPTISDLANQSINEDGATATMPFTVGDAQTAPGSLTVIATSSNPTLVPASGVVLGGTGANRTLTLRPAADQYGTAMITVQVSDGVLSATDTFVLTVVAVNDAPTLSAISGQTIERGGRTGAIAFTVADVETAAGSLALSASSSNPALVPVAGISFGGSGANRTVTVTPVAWQSGTASITVAVSDGTRTASQAFSVAVTFASQLVVGADVGAPALVGSTTSANGIFTMRAAGADIWGAKDQFHFAHQQIPGDAELIVRVRSLVQTHVWTKVGLMFRAGLAADAAHVSVFVTPQRGVSLQWRAANGGLTTGSPSLPGTAPEWLRLVRTGDTFYAFRSENGVAWELVEFATVDLPNVAFGGMAASSIKAQTLTTATFEHFRVD